MVSAGNWTIFERPADNPLPLYLGLSGCAEDPPAPWSGWLSSTLLGLGITNKFALLSLFATPRLRVKTGSRVALVSRLTHFIWFDSSVFAAFGTRFKVDSLHLIYSAVFAAYGTRFKVQGSRFKAQSSRLKVQSSKFKNQRSKIKVIPKTYPSPT